MKSTEFYKVYKASVCGPLPTAFAGTSQIEKPRTGGGRRDRNRLHKIIKEDARPMTSNYQMGTVLCAEVMDMADTKSMDKSKVDSSRLFSANQSDKDMSMDFHQAFPKVQERCLSRHEIRQKRIRVLEDVAKLHNRINLLQNEEERAIRHVAETKHRIKEMMQAKNEAIAEQRCEQKGRKIIRRIRKNRRPDNVAAVLSAARSNSPPTTMHSVFNS
jgi:DNA-binding protein H-NS